MKHLLLLSAALALMALPGCSNDGTPPAYASTQPVPPPIPPYASTQPVPPQPHPEHPIAEPPPEIVPPHPSHPIVHPILAGFLSTDARDRWLATPCQHATDGSEWCGHIPVPHVEHYQQ